MNVEEKLECYKITYEGFFIIINYCDIRLSGLFGVEREEAWKAFHLPRTKEEAVTRILMEDVQSERVAYCLFQIRKFFLKVFNKS